MEVFVKLKSAGKRHPILEDVPYELPDDTATLRQLIEAVVLHEVVTYNERGLENMLVPFLTEEEIATRVQVGKVGFGRLYSDRIVQLGKAMDTALQAFEDGLFRVMVGQREVVDLDCPLEIKTGDAITFIRLTFLAGRLW